MYFNRINEDDTTTIRCPENSIINVTKASYYKWNYKSGPDLSFSSSYYYDVSNQFCDSSSDIVSEMCNGEQSCNIHATEVKLGYPCFAFTKNYLNVSYICHRSRNGNNFLLKG